MATIVASLRGGARPEEDVAARFVTAMLGGDARTAYELTDPTYRQLVREADLVLVATALAAVAGEVDIEVVGSERTPGATPATSLVGYRGRSDAGAVEGVVTVVRRGADGPWLVRDLSYRFPEAAPDEVADLADVTRRLNEALAERAASATGPSPAP